MRSDQIRQERAGQDKTGQDGTGQDRTRSGWMSFGVYNMVANTVDDPLDKEIRSGTGP